MALTKVDISLVDNATGFTIVTKVVTVAASKLVIDGVSQDTLTLTEGYTYKFDTSHATLSGHTVSFATAADAAGSTQYTTGVTTSGTPGNAGAYTQIVVAQSAPTLYYYCANHASMGGQANTPAASIANKLLAYDGSGNMPAVDASQLTNTSTITSSASDPAIDTNPSGGVGTEWHNTTSGEVYICTDATAGANVWKNVGAGSGNIAPIPPTGNYGYIAGGQAGGVDWAPPHFVSNQISRFAFASGNASDFGSNLAVVVRYCASASSSTHGYSIGGLTTGNSAVDHIQKFTMASSSNATDIGNATVSKEGPMGTNSETYGFHIGGYPYSNDIGRWSFASDGDAVDWADLAVVSGFAMGCSDWDNGYGYVSTINTDQIQKFPFASQTNAVDTTQNLTVNANHSGSNSSATHGYSAGGNGSPHNHICKFQFNTSNHATDVGNLVLGRAYVGQTHPSSLTYGYSCGGTAPSAPNTNAATNNIEKFAFASDADAIDHGDLHQHIYAPAFAQL